MAKKVDVKIKALEENLKELRLQKKKQDDLEKNREATKLRKIDSRKKYLLGAWLFDASEKGTVEKKLLISNLDKYLTRDADRALFDLPPVPPKPKPTA